MKFPNKVTTYKESVLSKISTVLELISQKDMSIYDLYLCTKSIFDDITIFFDVLDCLFMLNEIEIIDIENTEVIHYVK